MSWNFLFVRPPAAGPRNLSDVARAVRMIGVVTRPASARSVLVADVGSAEVGGVRNWPWPQGWRDFMGARYIESTI